MKINIQSPYNQLTPITKTLLDRMLSPLCGMDHEIGFLLHSSRDANIVVTGAEMAGVHTLLNTPHPGRGAYHLGGCGAKVNEALIRTLGETVERYSQMTSEISGLSEYCFASHQHMSTMDDKVISLDQLNYFITQQYYQQNFPFDLYTSDQPITWIKLKSLLRRDTLWVPAQLVFVGYKVKRNKHEPWIASAVTTGTAAHTDPNQALMNAIMELIQIDSAMGHWYSAQSALKIEYDSRTTPLENLINRFVSKQKSAYEFYYLKNPDLPGFSVACVYRGNKKSIPQVAVGLGASMNLVDAMYKAFLEAVGVVGLSRMIIFDKFFDKRANLSHTTINPKTIYDLDSNVAYYALGNQRDFINKKFNASYSLKASELPNDIHLGRDKSIKFLLESFSVNHKELLFYDLTGVEAQQLGFVVPRVWSPDLLSLSLPSAPYLNHSRYQSYGGAHHDNPHPYP